MTAGARLRALDLFSGAGGAAMGLYRAGFDVVGVDIKPQPRYPAFHQAEYAEHFEFIQADALSLDVEFMREFDFIWASPPCQAYSNASLCQPGLQAKYPRHIDDIRSLLRATGRAYVIENVYASPLKGIMLCGAMFGRETYRHRLFESDFCMIAPSHPRHAVKASKAGHWKPGTYVSVAGNVAPIKLCREVMSIDWMNRRELAESIPPYYSQFIAQQALAVLGGEGKQ